MVHVPRAPSRDAQAWAMRRFQQLEPTANAVSLRATRLRPETARNDRWSS